jgi:hypothetical protein
MWTRILLTAVVALPLAAAAEAPNLQPGQWEFTNTTKMEGKLPIPPQKHSHQECITEEDLQRGDAFQPDEENCRVDELESGRAGMRYTMTCTEEGTEVSMKAEMRYLGDRMEGVIIGDMDSPVGPMRTHTTVEGRRLGACP